MPRIKVSLVLVLLALVAVAALVFARRPSSRGYQAHIQRVEDFSRVRHIDRIFPSMFGPTDDYDVVLAEGGRTEVLWITSARVDIVDREGTSELSPEYLCHSHLKFEPNTFDKDRRNAVFANTANQNLKLFTLIQGQEEIRLPEGFGIPVLSNEPLVFHSMVINNNEITEPVDVKVKTVFEFVRESDARGAVRPLFRTGAAMQVPVDQSEGEPEHGGECSTLPEQEAHLAANAKPVTAISTHEKGFLQSGHWLVPPGRHEYRYEIEGGIPVPFDTTAHYIAVHLHAYGESLELRDLTTDETLFLSRAENYGDRIGVADLEFYSNAEGIPIHEDHDYELVAIYNNTTDEPIDAMAIIYMYLHDKNFDISQARLEG